jgi:hypothetical protein
MPSPVALNSVPFVRMLVATFGLVCAVTALDGNSWDLSPLARFRKNQEIDKQQQGQPAERASHVVQCAQRVSRCSVCADRLSCVGFNNCLLVGRITIRVNGMRGAQVPGLPLGRTCLRCAAIGEG